MSFGIIEGMGYPSAILFPNCLASLSSTCYYVSIFIFIIGYQHFFVLCFCFKLVSLSHLVKGKFSLLLYIST